MCSGGASPGATVVVSPGAVPMRPRQRTPRYDLTPSGLIVSARALSAIAFPAHSSRYPIGHDKCFICRPGALIPACPGIATFSGRPYRGRTRSWSRSWQNSVKHPSGVVRPQPRRLNCSSPDLCVEWIRAGKLSVSPTGQSVTMSVVLPTGGPGSANR
jgi:hypothetical protein